MAAPTERRGSLANVRRASQAYWSSEPRQGSWSNIRRASAGFAPPDTAKRRRSLAASSLRKDGGEKGSPGSPDEEYGIGEVHEGEEKFHRLGWKKLTVCLIAEAIALGSLSIPNAFATVGMVPGVILFIVALPPTFAEFAILGYIDFVSIIVAIGITIIASGVKAGIPPGGLSAVDWSAWPPPETTSYKAFLSTTNIIFAYSFAVCQYSFMAEMHTPKDYVKFIWALGLIEVFICTVTGALVYAFVGSTVSSPAVLSAGPLVSRVAFGIALPVIFISGSINSTVVGRYILNRALTNSGIRLIHSKAGCLAWIGLIAAITLVAWVIAEAIPLFSALLGIISSLFISGFTFYFPALFWFQLIKEGKWYVGWKNITFSIINAVVFCIGLIVLGCGTYTSVQDIISSYASGEVRGSFTCDSSAYG